MPVPAAFAFATIPMLGRALRQQECTAVELAEFFLARLEEIGPRLNALVTLTRKRAMQEAAAADRELAAGQDRGPLHGIPYGAKDLLATAGIPTSWGAAPFREQVFEEDAAVIAKLHAAGAVLVAKLAMVEIAGGMGYEQANASFTGPGLNPWDETCWSGGSSSGSGSAVGGGLVPFAIGSETWGSIMTPAAYCGVSGLRPTYGRVSRRGAMALSWTMDKLGPMCRSAEDCGLVLAAIAGHDAADDSSLDLDFRYPGPPADPNRRWRLGRVRDFAEKLQPEVEANLLAAIDVLKDRADVSMVDLPNMPHGVVATTLIACEMAAAFEGLVHSGDVWELAAPEDRIGCHAARFIPAVDYLHAQRIRRHIGRALDGMFGEIDAFIGPTLPCVANPIATSFSEYFSQWDGTALGAAGNVAGLPAISIPCGFGAGRLPTGLVFVGRAGDEATILEIARHYQSRTDWHRRRPKGFEG